MNWETLQATIKTAISTAAALVQPEFNAAWCVYEDEPRPFGGDPLVLLDIMSTAEESPVREVKTVLPSGLTASSWSSSIVATIQIKVETINHTVGVKAIHFAESLRQALKMKDVQAVLNPEPDPDDVVIDRVALLGTIGSIRAMKRTEDGRALSVFVFEIQVRTEMHADDPTSGGVIERVIITAQNLPEIGETQVVDVGLQYLATEDLDTLIAEDGADLLAA